MLSNIQVVVILLLTISLTKTDGHLNDIDNINVHLISEWQVTNGYKFRDFLKHNYSKAMDSNRKVINYHFVYIDWRTIFPEENTVQPNQTEVYHYKTTIDYLLQNNIEPILVLYHKNLPEKFVSLGGWTNPEMVQHFANYSKQMFKLFEDQATNWITFYEPQLMCQNSKNFDLCVHNVLKAHAEVFHLYHKHINPAQDGSISMVLDIEWVEPHNATNVEDLLAAEEILHFKFGQFANLILGVDREVAKAGSPQFTYFEKLKIRGASDALWIKLSEQVTVVKVKEERKTRSSVNNDEEKIVLRSKIRRANHYQTKQLILNWIKNNYNDPDIMIAHHDLRIEQFEFQFYKNQVKTMLFSMIELLDPREKYT